jgi:beta-galactosidase
VTSHRWPDVPGLLFGGDYNPEQWPEEVWLEDVRLMREAGVNLVSLGIFSWALLEPREGAYDFGWLDRVMDLLHEHGIAVDLATATASPPPWLSRAHPEMLPELVDGTKLWWGSRQAYCPSSTAYRAAAVRLCTAIAERYRDHPALRMWHVNNEYGCHVAQCFCDVSGAAFRGWLQRRYADLDALNDAWGTAFWSQRYGDWDEIIPPRVSPTQRNPTQQLDWYRFSSDALLELYCAERDAVRAVSDKPITTELHGVALQAAGLPALGRGGRPGLQRPLRAEPGRPPAGRRGADRRPGARVRPAGAVAAHGDLTSAVNWQPRNAARPPGQLRRHALSQVARGADGILYFQWRASKAGAEKFHAGLVPHAGTDTKVWREVAALGAELAGLAACAGHPGRGAGRGAVGLRGVVGRRAGQPPVGRRAVPAGGPRVLRRAVAGRHHGRLRAPRGRPVRLRPAARPEPVPDDRRRRRGRQPPGSPRGASLVVSYFSGIVDEHDHVRLGGYPGALREVLGVRVEEFFPLLEGQAVAAVRRRHGHGLDRAAGRRPGRGAADRRGRAAARQAGHHPRVARCRQRLVPATSPDPATLRSVLASAAEAAGVRPAADVPEGVEAVRRGDRLFVINHTAEDVTVAGSMVPAGDAAVLPAG